MSSTGSATLPSPATPSSAARRRRRTRRGAPTWSLWALPWDAVELVDSTPLCELGLGQAVLRTYGRLHRRRGGLETVETLAERLEPLGANKIDPPDREHLVNRCVESDELEGH